MGLLNVIGSLVPASRARDGLNSFIAGWTGLENCYKPIFARFNGTDNYLVSDPIATTVLRDEGTVILWVVIIDLGGGNVKIYDIGNGVTASDFTTRIRAAFNADPLLADLRFVLADTAYNNVADVSGILQGDGANQWRFNEPTLLYLSYKNDNVDGAPLTSRIQVGINGQIAFDDTFENAGGGDGAAQIGFNINDRIAVGVRHDLATNFHNGDLGEVWSTPKFMEHDANIDSFLDPTPRTGFPNGTPVGRTTGAPVAGNVPSNHFGGLGYTIADWNNGNNGLGANYTRNGVPFIEGIKNVWSLSAVAEGTPASQTISSSGMVNTAQVTGGQSWALYGLVPDQKNVSDGVIRIRYRTSDMTGSLQARNIPTGTDFGGGHLIVADGLWQEWIVSVPVPAGSTQVLIRALTNISIGTMECQWFWDTLPTGGVIDDEIATVKLRKPVSFTDAVAGWTFVKNQVDEVLGVESVFDPNFLAGCGTPSVQWQCSGILTDISGGQLTLPADDGSFQVLVSQQHTNDIAVGDTARIEVDIAALNGASDVQVFPNNNVNGVTFTTLGKSFQDVVVDSGTSEYAIYNIAGAVGETAVLNSISIKKFITAGSVDEIATINPDINISPANPLAFDLTWPTPEVAGDVTKGLYDKATGNLLDTSTLTVPNITLHDEFNGTAGVLLRDRPILPIDGGEAWLGGGYEIAADGVSATNGIASGEVQLVIPIPTAYGEVIIQSAENPIAATRTSAILVRRADANNELRCQLRKNAGASTWQINFRERVGGVNNDIPSIQTNVSMFSPATFAVESDGINVTCYFKEEPETKLTIVVNPLLTGTNVGMRGSAFAFSDSILDWKLFDVIPTFVPLESQTIVLKNCLDVTSPVSLFQTFGDASALLSASLVDSGNLSGGTLVGSGAGSVTFNDGMILNSNAYLDFGDVFTANEKLNLVNSGQIMLDIDSSGIDIKSGTAVTQSYGFMASIVGNAEHLGIRLNGVGELVIRRYNSNLFIAHASSDGKGVRTRLDYMWSTTGGTTTIKFYLNKLLMGEAISPAAMVTTDLAQIFIGSLIGGSTTTRVKNFQVSLGGVDDTIAYTPYTTLNFYGDSFTKLGQYSPVFMAITSETPDGKTGTEYDGNGNIYDTGMLARTHGNLNEYGKPLGGNRAYFWGKGGTGILQLDGESENFGTRIIDSITGFNVPTVSVISIGTNDVTNLNNTDADLSDGTFQTAMQVSIDNLIAAGNNRILVLTIPPINVESQYNTAQYKNRDLSVRTAILGLTGCNKLDTFTLFGGHDNFDPADWGQWDGNADDRHPSRIGHAKYARWIADELNRLW